MERLNEWAHYAGADVPERAWLLHPGDVWVRNPWFAGDAGPHPEAGPDEDEEVEAPECKGHPAGPFDPMGQTVYCDGSCRVHARPVRAADQ